MLFRRLCSRSKWEGKGVAQRSDPPPRASGGMRARLGSRLAERARCIQPIASGACALASRAESYGRDLPVVGVCGYVFAAPLVPCIGIARRFISRAAGNEVKCFHVKPNQEKRLRLLT